MASISLAVAGRPGLRRALPSYLPAMSLRCQLSNVSGVTIVAISASILLPTSRALAARLFPPAGLWRPGCDARHRLGEVGGCRAEPAGFGFPRANTRRHAVVADSSIRQQ